MVKLRLLEDPADTVPLLGETLSHEELTPPRDCARLSLPAANIFPSNALTGSTEDIMASFTSACPAFALIEKINAAAPATCGVAMDVPLQLAVRLFGRRLKMRTPGAARSTLFFP